jgi:hypothetical protein
METDVCCPEFIPEPWNNKIERWDERLFIKDSVRTFFYMPFGFGKVMERVFALAQKSGAVFQDNMCLSDHVSKWKMNIYLPVDKEIEGAENIKISGEYFFRVYEGKFSETGKWCKDYKEVTDSKGWSVKRWLMWYTTCPKCAKKYGKNYVVIAGEVIPKIKS